MEDCKERQDPAAWREITSFETTSGSADGYTMSWEQDTEESALDDLGLNEDPFDTSSSGAAKEGGPCSSAPHVQIPEHEMTWEVVQAKLVVEQDAVVKNIQMKYFEGNWDSYGSVPRNVGTSML